MRSEESIKRQILRHLVVLKPHLNQYCGQRKPKVVNSHKPFKGLLKGKPHLGLECHIVSEKERMAQMSSCSRQMNQTSPQVKFLDARSVLTLPLKGTLRMHPLKPLGKDAFPPLGQCAPRGGLVCLQ